MLSFEFVIFLEAEDARDMTFWASKCTAVMEMRLFRMMLDKCYAQHQ